MGYSFLQLQTLQVFGLVIFTFLCLWTMTAKSKAHKNKHRSPPEPAGAWPLFGHLHLLGADVTPLHRKLGDMADKYGPAFAIRLGLQQALVVSNWEVAKECLTTNDKTFSTRPRTTALKLMAYDHSVFGFATYGPYWRDVRKLAVSQLLSCHRLEMLKHVRDSEVKYFVKEVYDQWVAEGGMRQPVLVEMKQKIADMATNIILRMVAGKRYDGSNREVSRRFQKAMAEFMRLVGLPIVSDAIPFLGWLDVLNGYRGEMKRSAREADEVLTSWLEEHRRKRRAGSIKESDKDFIDVMLSLAEENQLPYEQDPNVTIKSTCLSMILGGNETTVITLTWAISLLLNNRHVLKRAQDELDVQIGRHRRVEESDTKDLVYLQAIVKETLRLYPALPLSATHQAMEVCTVAGFHIAAGTQLYLNLWQLHRDPNIWSDPMDFKPERFLTEQKDVDVKGQHYEFLPFGSGRRMCPGATFALQVMHLMLARLLHGFELGTVKDLQVDMAESPGLTLPKANQLEVLLTPRLSSAALYDC